MDNKIINGERIGRYSIGTHINQLKTMLAKDYSVEERANSDVIITENFKFWIDKTSNTIKQISVYNNFDGKFLDEIGIGSTLKEVLEKVGKYKENLDVYILEEYPGICFELVDDDDWNELTSPIEFISIYK